MDRRESFEHSSIINADSSCPSHGAIGNETDATCLAAVWSGSARKMVVYEADDISPDMSFLEMLMS